MNFGFTGFNPNLPSPGGHCGGGMPAPGSLPAGPIPRFGPDGRPTIFPMPALPAGRPDPFNGERFVTTEQGGFIVGKDGALAGRVPAGAFVDTKDGKLYGPDSKPIDVPEGAKVDFVDLPDLDHILKMVKAATGGGDGEIRGERFISSGAGGVIIGTDGAIAGRIPAGAFVDAKDGKVYGPDSKPIAIPEGAKVDFFDLPDLDVLLRQVRGGGTSPSPGDAPYPMKTMVDGQWGPGGVTLLKGGTQVGGAAGAGAGCDMEHGGPPTTKAGGPGGQAASLNSQLSQGLAQLQRMGIHTGGPFSGRDFPGSHQFHPVWGGGAATAVGGASGLGSIPSLDSSLRELVKTLNELTAALAKTTAGGKVEQKPEPTAAKPTTESGSTTTSSGSGTTASASGTGSTTTSNSLGSGLSSSSTSTSTSTTS